MLRSGKRTRQNNASFLIEAVIACAVLSVGLVGVMQSFAMQRKAVTANLRMTQALLALQTCAGALYAGVRTGQLSCSGDQVRKLVMAKPLEISGLNEVHLIFDSAALSTRSQTLVFYVREGE